MDMFSKTVRYLSIALLLCALPALAAAFTVDISSDKAAYYQGEPINITVHAFDGGSPITSPSKRLIIIKDQSGNRLVRTKMSNDGNGYYSYTYNLATNAPEGQWSLKAVFTDNGQTVRKTIYVDVSIYTSGGGGGTHGNLTWSDYPTACLGCHTDEFNEMADSTHYKWVGDSPDMTNQPELQQGKLTNAVNSYCINILGDWKICGKCHVGRGLRPDDQAAGLENIDCLMCHNADYALARDRQADGSMAPPAGTSQAVLDGYVQNIAKPTRANCLKCHANAGGGNAVKRGDLSMETISNNDPNFDVHMNTSGDDLQCQECHVFSSHKTIGKGSDLRPTDDLARGAELKCTNCHNANPHGSNYSPGYKEGHPSSAYIRDRHANEAVACQTCHIPTYAKVETEMHRDWRRQHDGSLADGSHGPGHPYADKASDQTPEYLWWDRTSNNYLLGDNAYLTYDADKGTYPTSRPNGSFQNGKIYPFKYKTADQPMVSADGVMLALDTLVYLGQTGDVNQAIESGLANQGYPTNEPVEWITTDTYQLINHGVEPSNNIGCSDCHDFSGMTTNGRLDFAALGYHEWPDKVKNCTLCHESKNMSWQDMHEKHAEEMGKNCVGCHNSGPTGFVESPTKYGLCNNCHSGKSYNDPQDLHKEHAEAEHGGMTTTCTDCHTF